MNREKETKKKKKKQENPYNASVVIDINVKSSKQFHPIKLQTNKKKRLNKLTQPSPSTIVTQFFKTNLNKST